MAASGQKSKPVQRAKAGRGNTLRQMHLLFILQSVQQPISRDELLKLVDDYRNAPDSDSRLRMFERDKLFLRELGVDLEVISIDDIERYRVRSRDFILPEVDFTAAERGVLAIAQRVWGEQSVGEEARGALAKLAAAGVEVDAEPGRAFQSNLTADPSLAVFWRANSARQRVKFTYRSSRGDVRERDLEPWVLGQRAGAWYVIGLDRTRQESRKFKLARIVGTPQTYGKPGAYRVPADVDPVEIMASITPEQGREHAVVAVRGEYAPPVRRRSKPTDHPGTPPGYAAFALTYTHDDALVADLAPYGADVLVLEPPHLRQLMMDHFVRVVAAHGPATTGQGEHR